jgi:hypothetical protein
MLLRPFVHIKASRQKQRAQAISHDIEN